MQRSQMPELRDVHVPQALKNVIKFKTYHYYSNIHTIGYGRLTCAQKVKYNERSYQLFLERMMKVWPSKSNDG